MQSPITSIARSDVTYYPEINWSGHMPVPEHFRQALSQEFGCFYEVSELPETWDDWMANLEDLASTSATRILHWLDNAFTSQLAAYLRVQSQERRGELVREIDNWTRFDWSYRDEDWQAFQRILNAIADHLDRS